MLKQVARRTGFLVLLTLAACGATLIAKRELVPNFQIVREGDEIKISLHQAEERGNSLPVFEPPYTGQDNSAREYGSARSDHAAIALGIAHCYQGYSDPLKWSSPTRAVLLFNLNEQSMHSLPIQGVTSNDQPPPTLNAFHTAAISYSDRISRDRLYFRKELEDSRNSARNYQLLILGIGALATIAIGAKSMLPSNTRPSLSITLAIGAIALSAAGTAASSLSSFDGSQAIALRDKRTLSQLQQLHWRVASDVLKSTQLCNTPDNQASETVEQVNAWKVRLETILDNAVESVSQPGDLSHGSETSKAMPVPNGPPATFAGSSVSASAATIGSNTGRP